MSRERKEQQTLRGRQREKGRKIMKQKKKKENGGLS